MLVNGSLVGQMAMESIHGSMVTDMKGSLKNA